MTAAAQAPIIMMSQNRQAERDRTQNDFVSRAILRNEHQTRHVDAKLDHLLTYQWKRLLEIQEIQTQLLQANLLQNAKTDHHHPVTTDNSTSYNWTAETCPDNLTTILLKKHLDPNTIQDPFIFSHWHTNGDNFIGIIESVELQMEGPIVKSITFKLNFAEIAATLDDLFSGQETIMLRDDFNVPGMQHLGSFLKAKVTII